MLKIKAHKIHNKKESERLPHGEEVFDYHIKEILVGHRSIVALMGFTVGGIVVGRTIWEYSTQEFGLFITLLIGILLFSLSGLYLGLFKE